MWDNHAIMRALANLLLLVALMIGTSTALFPYFATGMTGAVVLIALWGFAFGAFPACASIWMFVVAPKDVERAVVALRQSAERIAHGSFTAEDVEIARKPLLARLAQLRQDNGWWADMLDGSVDTPEGASEPMTYPDIYAALTLDEIRAVAARWLSKPPIVVVVTPKSDAGTATANQGSGK